jgi:sarcosine oxidase delta subunit
MSSLKNTTDWLDENNKRYTVRDSLVYVYGYIAISERQVVALENLAEVSDYVYVRENATFNAPALTEVSDYVYVRENATFTAPMLHKSGCVYVYENATFNAPMLQKSNYVSVHENATFNAPVLAEISSSIYIYENTTFNAPELTTIGEVRFNTEMFGHKVEVFDGMGCVTVSQKTRDGVIIRLCRKASFKDKKLVGEKFFVVSSNGHNAHGKTLDAAISDLMFKKSDRDLSSYRNMPMDTIKTPYEWATVYRVITGACQYGTESFINQKSDLKEQYTLSEIIEQTRGAYGSETFRKVIGQ